LTTAERPRDPGVIALVRQLVGGVVRLARLELTHGRQEIARMLGSVRTGLIFLGLALIFLIMMLITLVVFIVLGISALLGWASWLVALIVFAALLLLAAGFGIMGVLKVRSIGPPEETIESVKEDIAWAKRLLRRE
jgi:uncharacterized membrane protein YqjE